MVQAIAAPLEELLDELDELLDELEELLDELDELVELDDELDLPEELEELDDELALPEELEELDGLPDELEELLDGLPDELLEVELEELLEDEPSLPPEPPHPTNNKMTTKRVDNVFIQTLQLLNNQARRGENIQSSAS